MTETVEQTTRSVVGPVVRVDSPQLAQVLYEEITSVERKFPIVGLTCRPGKLDPALPVDRVREKIWPGVPIYVIAPRESRTLFDLLPTELGVYNGAARVWWPGVDADTTPAWHPLIFDTTKLYGEECLDRLAAEFARVPESVQDLSPREQAAIRLRSVPRPADGNSGAHPETALIPLATRRDFRRLTSDLRRDDRTNPIVVIAPADDPDAPGFPLDAVRDALEPDIPVYVLGASDLRRRLEESLGSDLSVGDGDARIFWSGVGRDSDPAAHPSVPARSETDQRGPVERLVAALDLSRPDVRGHVVSAEERLRAEQQRLADTSDALRRAQADGRSAVARAESAEADLASAERQLKVLADAGLDSAELDAIARMDPEALLQRLIFREYLVSLQATDRREHVLGGYRFGPRFLQTVEHRKVAASRSRIAFAAAMVACGRAGELPGLERRQWRSGNGTSEEPQTVRDDGAKGWMCGLGHGSGAAILLYWALPDGSVEFDSVRHAGGTGQGQ